MPTPLIDRTAGELVTPTGERLSMPASILSADAAAILRNYFYWALSQQLEPELFCATCYDGTRQSKAQYHITEHEIEIICGCQIRFFQGPWVKPEPFRSVPLAKRSDTIGPALVMLSTDAARLLRQYKKVLSDLGLKEALRCNACYALNQDDGCEAQVLSQSIRIRCRCSNRTHHGMTT